MAPKKIDPVVKGRVLELLNEKASYRVIKSKLNAENIQISLGVISKIKSEKNNLPKKCKKSKKRSLLGRPKSVVTNAKLNKIKRMASQINPPSQRQMGKVIVHRLTKVNIEKRKKRSWDLYRSLNNGKWKKYITTDEAWFYMNNVNGTRRIQYVSRDLKHPTLEVYQRRQNHSSGFMVWGGASFNVGRECILLLNLGLYFKKSLAMRNVKFSKRARDDGHC
ncbi:hypothetical protein ILUMI_20296 [Ignelater luminosus]|uniref:Transposase n=1 Tax=Ignelater luminosus TaxID=2038154 RepID=A0A8K0CGM2_IGNLU|nr:hypothetical protein ILUMI_20296 [Ignelater luminosus]